MQLTQTKIKQLELIASKFMVNPDLLVDALLDVGLKKDKNKKVPEFSNEQKAINNLDRLLWGEKALKNLSIKKEELSGYLKTSQKNAIELKKRCNQFYDQFDAIEIAVDLLTCVLENRPPEGATTIPTIRDFDNWVIGIKQNLEENDLQRLRNLRQKALDSINSNKSMVQIIEEVFPGSRQIDPKILDLFVPYQFINPTKSTSIYAGFAPMGYPQKWAIAIGCAQEGAHENIRKKFYIGENTKEVIEWLSLSYALDLALEKKLEKVNIYINSIELEKQIKCFLKVQDPNKPASIRINNEEIKKIAISVQEKIKQIPFVNIRHDDILTKQMNLLAEHELDIKIGALKNVKPRSGNNEINPALDIFFSRLFSSDVKLN